MSEPVRILVGDVIDGLKTLGDGSVQCCVTSPPYWGLRDYGVDGQIGLEPTPEAFIEKMVEVFREVRRVLREDGTLWLNIGDSYNAYNGGRGVGGSTLDGRTQCGLPDLPTGHGLTAKGLKPKDLCMMPWRVAMALQADGWWIRSVIVWAKKSPMPESCRDRPTSSWEPIFLMAKSERYFYDAEAVKEPVTGGANPHGPNGHGQKKAEPGEGNRNNTSFAAATRNATREDLPTSRNMRNVWHLGPEPYSEAHFATFPTEIPRRAIKAGTSEKGCCPKCGAGWRRVVAKVPGETPGANGSSFTSGKTGSVHAGTRGQGDRYVSKPVGWEPGCACVEETAGGTPAPPEPVPCVVLDPFLGSGTTVAVARQLGRWGVGCELNPEYAKLARVRIGKAEKPHTFADDRVKGDAPLFAESAAGGAA